MSSAAGDSKRQALDYLLGQSSIYAQIIGDKLERERTARANAESRAAKKQEKAAAATTTTTEEPAKRNTRVRTATKQAPRRSSPAKNAETNKRKRTDENQLTDVMSQQVKLKTALFKDSPLTFPLAAGCSTFC